MSNGFKCFKQVAVATLRINSVPCQFRLPFRLKANYMLRMVKMTSSYVWFLGLLISAFSSTGWSATDGCEVDIGLETNPQTPYVILTNGFLAPKIQVRRLFSVLKNMNASQPGRLSKLYQLARDPKTHLQDDLTDFIELGYVSPKGELPTNFRHIILASVYPNRSSHSIVANPINIEETVKLPAQLPTAIDIPKLKIYYAKVQAIAKFLVETSKAAGIMVDQDRLSQSIGTAEGSDLNLSLPIIPNGGLVLVMSQRSGIPNTLNTALGGLSLFGGISYGSLDSIALLRAIDARLGLEPFLPMGFTWAGGGTVFNPVYQISRDLDGEPMREIIPRYYPNEADGWKTKMPIWEQVCPEGRKANF